MTRWLIRLFIKDSEDTSKPAVRAAYGNLACVAGILCNLLLFAGKFTVGTLFGSVAIAADGMNNLSDAGSSVVSLIGFRLGAARRMTNIPSAMPGTSTWPVWRCR